MKTLKEQQAEAWRLAPDDATHIAQDGDDGRWHSYIGEPRQEKEHDYWLFYRSASKICRLYQGVINGWDWRDTLQSREEWEDMNSNHDEEDLYDRIARMRQEENPQCDWVNGLPSVGTECEIIFDDDDTPRWFPIEWYGTKDGRPIFCDLEVDKREIDWVHSTRYRLRPIKSKADNLRDEQIKLLDACIVKADSPSPKRMATKMHELGCRMTRELTDYDIQQLWEYQDWGVNEVEFTAIAKAIAACVRGETAL